MLNEEPMIKVNNYYNAKVKYQRESDNSIKTIVSLYRDGELDIPEYSYSKTVNKPNWLEKMFKISFTDKVKEARYDILVQAGYYADAKALVPNTIKECCGNK